MTSTESGEEYASRRLFVIGTGHYASAEYEDRTRIPKVLGQVVDLLAPFDFQVHFATLGYLLDPDRTTLRDKIRQARATADLVVIYYTGHGEYINHEGYHLITTDFTETDLPEAGVKVVDLPVWIAARNSAGGVAPQQAPTLVILDCCFSGTGAIDLLHDAVLEKRANPAYANLWMWATAGNLQWADAGLFPDALAGALAHSAIGASTREIPLMTLLDQVNATLRTSAADQESEIIPPNGRITSSPPFFPNPDHLPNVAGMTVDAQHWISKARGTESPATGFYLAGRSGRVQAARDLIQWILDPGRGGLAVVTGSPGTGKSTLLALPAILTDHVGRLALLNQTNTESLAHQTATLLPQDTIILAVHARGLNVDQIATRIAKLLARTASGVATLIASLSDQPPTSATTILIDALDEGNDHELIRDVLILELVRHGIPVIVGVRPSVLLPTDLTTITIDLDEDPYHDPEALTDYIEQLLVAAHEPELRSPYRLASGQPHPGTRTIAAAIASRATSGQVESFLIARVVALALRARPTPVDPTDADWSDQLPAGLEGAFEEDISRLAQRTPAARVLLEALAWARGPGMPWETLWVPVAQALARLHSDPGQVVLPSDDDVRKLLADAGAYVVEDLGPGQRSVFRPFHGLLAEYLRNSRRESAAGVNVTRVEDSITNALLGTVPNDNQRRRRWGRAHPYLHTYLAGHALPTGHFDELLTEGGFLATADPATLMPLLVNAKPASDDVVRVYRRARSQLGDDPQANTAYLYEAATAVRARESIGDTGYRPLYDTRWSLIRADNSQLTLTAHTRPLNAVALATAIRAQLMLASAGDDGAIRLWNPDTGSEIGDPITGHAQTVQALAFGTSTDDRPVLASAGGDGIRFWNPYSGLAIGDPLVVPRGEVRALAFGTSTDDRPVFASAGSDGTIRLWNPDNGLPIGDPLVVPRGAVRALALGTNSQGRLILAYGGADGTIRLRNPETGKAIGEPLRGHRGPIRALAFGTNSGGLSMLASAGGDGTVRLWHPDTGRALTRPLRGHHGLVNAVAFGATTDRHAFLASAGDDHTIRLWDPD
ncbi:WD40 repeat domain-containing protein, partial [Rhodococcus globerulus]